MIHDRSVTSNEAALPAQKVAARASGGKIDVWAAGVSLLQLLVRAPCATPWRPARTHEPAAADPTRVRVAQLAVEGREHPGAPNYKQHLGGFFSDAAANAGIKFNVKNIFASALLEPRDDSPAFRTRSADAQLAFPPRMRQKLADVRMTSARPAPPSSTPAT